MSSTPTIPSERDLLRLPFCAILALGARCARRVEPLFQTWKGAPDEHVRALSQAIRAVEDLARCPNAPAGAPFWIGAADAALQAANAASAADRASAPPAALRAADAAAELADAIDTPCTRQAAAHAVSRSLQASAQAIEQMGSQEEQEFLAGLERDLEKLRLHASVEGWTDDTGIGVQILDA